MAWMTVELTFDQFIKTVCPQRNLDWRKYRRASRRKVLARIHELGLSGFSDYAEYLNRNPGEASALPNLLRVTVSRFFREKETWQDLATTVLPLLFFRRATSGKILRILSIGCCNGEEPYSLALLWKAGLEAQFPENRISITALDVDPDCLRRARKAVYARKTLREVPPELRESWFEPLREGYRLNPVVSRLVDFKLLDLLSDPIPGGQDLILCRYLVFTYYHGELQRKTVNKITQALNPGGILILGDKEKPGPETRSVIVPVSGAKNSYIAVN